ncbi:MAG: hypothetical protein KAR40_15460 [Candidatus Sabulitectum sp.]|nr:hypothetical protein [Candidatus Sabulitectum sp.]
MAQYAYKKAKGLGYDNAYTTMVGDWRIFIVDCRSEGEAVQWVAYSNCDNCITEFGSDEVTENIAACGETRDIAVNLWLNQIEDGTIVRRVHGVREQRLLDFQGTCPICAKDLEVCECTGVELKPTVSTMKMHQILRIACDIPAAVTDEQIKKAVFGYTSVDIAMGIMNAYMVEYRRKEQASPPCMTGADLIALFTASESVGKHYNAVHDLILDSRTDNLSRLEVLRVQNRLDQILDGAKAAYDLCTERLGGAL